MNKLYAATSLLLMILPEVVTSQVPRLPAQLVAEVGVVTARTPEGRVSSFTDAGGREFAVGFDESGRVASVLAVAKRHVSDIISIGYAPDGRIIGAQLGSGETLFFHYAADGATVIRSSVAEAQTQKGERLREKAARLKELLAALNN